MQSGNKVEFSYTTNDLKCLVAHWADGKEGEQARSECEGRELEISEWLSQRDEVCAQT